MQEQDYIKDIMDEQYKKPKNKKGLKFFIFSLILTIIVLSSAFGGGFYTALRTHNVVSDEDYQFLKNFDETSIETINKFDLLIKSVTYADENFYKNLDYEKLDKIAALAVMNSLDDYSSMKSSEDIMDSSIKASVGAIITTSIYNEYTIQYVFETSTGYGELLRGDRIYAVNDNRVEGLPFEYFRYYTSGGEGTVLKLSIDRPIVVGNASTFERKEISVTKTLATNKQAYYINDLGGTINNDIGYIKLLSFTGTAYDDFKNCIDKFNADTNKALILDLRNNGGGSGEILDKIASYLIKNKSRPLDQEVPIIELQNAKTGKSQVFKTTDSYNCLDIPIYILCNKGTASASEALIGAIDYYETGTLIGTTTYGKGVAQYVDYSNPVADNDNEKFYVSLTIGFYYVYTKDTVTYPNGKYTIDGVGITPKTENVITDLTDKINLYDDAFIKRADELYNIG